MIETVILNYLKTELNMNDVYMEIPTPIPTTYVTIELVDRNKTDFIEAVTFELMSVAPSKYESALLDEKVRQAMDNIIVLDEVMSSKCGGGNDSTDTQNKNYRYRCYYNLYL